MQNFGVDEDSKNLRIVHHYRIFKFENFPDPVWSKISDLLLFLSYFASQNKEIKFGNYFFNAYCVN